MTGPLRREPGWLSVVRAIRRAQADGRHPTHRDLEDATGLVAITQRVSDARAHGHDIECVTVRDSEGRPFKRYWLHEGPEQMTLDVA